MFVHDQDLPPSAHERQPRGVRFLTGSSIDHDPLCRLSSLCGGTLPLLGSPVAFAALATVAVMV